MKTVKIVSFLEIELYNSIYPFLNSLVFNMSVYIIYSTIYLSGFKEKNCYFKF